MLMSGYQIERRAGMKIQRAWVGMWGEALNFLDFLLHFFVKKKVEKGLVCATGACEAIQRNQARAVLPSSTKIY